MHIMLLFLILFQIYNYIVTQKGAYKVTFLDLRYLYILNSITFTSYFYALFCFGFYVTPTQYMSFGDVWRKTSGALPCIISVTNGHLSRTTDVP
jgi:hypothetical protein